MERSTSKTLATNMSITLSLLALKSFSIWVISAAVSFSRVISNYLSYFYISIGVLFLLGRGIRPLSVDGTCSLLARLPLWLLSVYAV